jgi:1,4-dihydroxy-2-naphthoate polyprenyltransferase
MDGGWIMNRETLKSWIQASRPPFFIATFIPLTAGWILGSKIDGWHPGRFMLILLGSFLVHLATNLANDYFDHVQGADAGSSIGGSRVIQEGKISPSALLAAIIACYAVALMIGLGFTVVLNLWNLLPFIAIAFFSSLFYVAPPVRYGYHGLGELFVGINMGPVMVVGTYLVISRRLDWEPFIVSIPIGIMVALILYYQSLPDMETDRAAGKRTLAVRLGRQGAIRGLILFVVFTYLAIVILIVTGYLSPLAMASLLTILLIVKLLGVIHRTANWVKLDHYGYYVRMLYFFNGLLIIMALIR